VVRGIHPRRLDLDEHLARARPGIGNIVEQEHGWRAELVSANRLHHSRLVRLGAPPNCRCGALATAREMEGAGLSMPGADVSPALLPR
jgi:hypothetical protein